MKEAGYNCAVSTYSTTLTIFSDLYRRIRRTVVEQGVTPNSFQTSTVFSLSIQ